MFHYAAATLPEGTSFVQIVRHELGHNFARLDDEYGKDCDEDIINNRKWDDLVTLPII